MSAAGTAAIIGLVMDAAMGGLTLATAFQEFKKSRPKDMTEEDAAREFAEEMLSQVAAEAAADQAIGAWMAKHGSKSPQG